MFQRSSLWLLSRLLSNSQASTSSGADGLRAIATSPTCLRLLRDPQPPRPAPEGEPPLRPTRRDAKLRPAARLPAPPCRLPPRSRAPRAACARPPQPHPRPLLPAGLEGAEKPDLVARYLSLDNAPRADQSRAALHAALAEFQRFKGDTGSSEAQVGLLTARIRSLADHLSAHRKDHSSRRGLQAMLTQRRCLLQYLRRTRFDAYAALISKLGLKDAPYAPQDRYTIRYKAGKPGGGGGGGGAKRR